MENVKKFIKNYLPDIFVILGIWILSYNILRPPTNALSISFTDYHTEWKVFGIVLITIAVDIAIRRYIKHKNKD